jgi:hypothetical protein
MAVMNGSGDLRERANRMYDEAAAQVRSGQLAGAGLDSAASQIESLASETDNEVFSEEIRGTAAALRELPAFLAMQEQIGPVGDSGLVGQAEEISDWGSDQSFALEHRLERAQDAYRRLNALPQGNRVEEFAISEMINELAEQIHSMGGEPR